MAKTVESRGPMPSKNVRLRGKNQVTIPVDIIEKLQLNEGEQLEVIIENGRIVLIPVVTIEKDQAWFWTEEWQKGEREADEDIRNGQLSEAFNHAEDAIKWLKSDKSGKWANDKDTD